MRAKAGTYVLWKSPAGWTAPVERQGRLVALILKVSEVAVREELREKFPDFSEINTDLSRSCVQQLEEYFSGNRRRFELPIDLERRTDFSRRVLEALAGVPYGCCVTYTELAGLAGSPRAARAVGRVMASNPLPLVVPCHRVVGSDGSLTGFSGGSGIGTKQWLLNHEKTHSEG